MSKPLLMKNIAINPEDYTILAVDDIATNIMLLKAVLSRAKYKIVTASGGNEALEKAARSLPLKIRTLSCWTS